MSELNLLRLQARVINGCYKVWLKKRYICIVSNYVPMRYLLITKEVVILQWRNHLNQAIKFNITSNETHYHHMSSVKVHWAGTHHHFCGILAQIAHPKLDHEETSDKTKFRDILQNNWTVFLKASRSWKAKNLSNERRLKKYSNWM